MKNNVYSQALMDLIEIYYLDGLQDVYSCYTMFSFYIFMCGINNIPEFYLSVMQIDRANMMIKLKSELDDYGLAVHIRFYITTVSEYYLS